MEAAYILRKEILQIKPTKLPEKLTVRDVIKGEAEIPHNLRKFYEILITNDGMREKKEPLSDNKKRRVQSLSYDAIYAVTNGETKTSKHILLGMLIYFLTRSRMVLQILNRFGACVSYEVAEECETEIVYSATEVAKLLPDGLHELGDLHTGLAFDNHDMFCDTLTGKDTLHDTVGICYQDILQEHFVEALYGNRQGDISAPVPLSEETRKRRRRRRFSAENVSIEPFRKSIRIDSQSMLTLDDPRRTTVSPYFEEAKTLDFIWMLLVSLGVDNVPMWTGWNSLLAENVNSKQIIRYLPQIDASPTSDAVVAQTLKTAVSIKEECGQRYMPVTYDLAIYKKARGIQVAESPIYDMIFPLLGKNLKFESPKQF